MLSKKMRAAMLSALIAAAIFSLSAAVAFKPSSAAADEAQAGAVGGIESVYAELDDGITVKYEAAIPDGYSEPRLEIARGEKSVVLTPELSDGRAVFGYGGVRAAAMDETLSAKLTAVKDGERTVLDENQFCPADYWKEILGKSEEELGLEHFSYLATRALAVNALRFGSAVSGKDFLADANAADDPLAFKNENGAWGLQDYAGESAEGFGWEGVSADLTQGFYLRYRFASASTELRAKVEFRGKTSWMTPVKTGETSESGAPIYVFGYPFAADEFCFDATVAIYSGDARISSALTYGMNRALAAIGGEAETALWALGKAAAWYRHESELEYCFLPNITDNGLYATSIYDYVYDGEYMIVESSGLSGNAAWVAGKPYTETDAPAEGDGYTVGYDADKGFEVALSGVEADGVIAMNGGLTLSVEADSTISGAFYRNWDDKNGRIVSTLGAAGDILISGESGKTLTVNGRILAGGKLTVSGGVSVEVVVENADYNGVEANSVTVSDGSGLTVVYEGAETSSAAGIRTIDDVIITDSELTVRGFGYGALFGGNQQDLNVEFRAEGSTVELVGNGYGMSAVSIPGADWNGWVGTNWTIDLNLDGGAETYIEGDRGTEHADVTLGDASLTVNATLSGIGTTWVPTKITTTGGSSEVGKLSVTVTNMHDGAFAVYPRSLEINGGTLNLYAGNMDGVAAIATATTWNLDNCKMTIKNTSVGYRQGEEIIRTYGVNAQVYDAKINILAGADVTITGADVPILSWMPPEYGNTPYVYIVGKLTFDDFIASPWEWGLTVQYSNLNFNFTNKREA